MTLKEMEKQLYLSEDEEQMLFLKWQNRWVTFEKKMATDKQMKERYCRARRLLSHYHGKIPMARLSKALNFSFLLDDAPQTKIVKSEMDIFWGIEAIKLYEESQEEIAALKTMPQDPSKAGGELPKVGELTMLRVFSSPDDFSLNALTAVEQQHNSLEEWSPETNRWMQAVLEAKKTSMPCPEGPAKPTLLARIFSHLR